jgi:hypothetical protein
MLKSKSMLQFLEPKPGEPICSGPELTLAQGQRIDLAHFHTVVTVILSRPRALIFTESTDTSLACAVTINGREYDRQQFVITRDDIGKTLFCAGFPCVTVTGMDEQANTVMLTQSEIVELCEPGTCPWGED